MRDLPDTIVIPLTFKITGEHSILTLRSAWITADVPELGEVSMTGGLGLGHDGLFMEVRGGRAWAARMGDVFRTFVARLDKEDEMRDGVAVAWTVRATDVNELKYMVEQLIACHDHCFMIYQDEQGERLGLGVSDSGLECITRMSPEVMVTKERAVAFTSNEADVLAAVFNVGDQFNKYKDQDGWTQSDREVVPVLRERLAPFQEDRDERE